MSNKKLFWIVFFILSCFEFAQVAYSKNIPESTFIPTSITTNFSHTELHYNADKALGTHYVFYEKPSRYLQPR